MLRFLKEHKELKYLAYHDSLTGLLNRNWLYKNIDSINCTYVYFVDINDLRKFNKKGHTFGDKHIKRVIRSIGLSKDDIFVRYAGDEFILFSNKKDAIKTNELIAVGSCKLGRDLLSAIRTADYNMLVSKKAFKQK